MPDGTRSASLAGLTLDLEALQKLSPAERKRAEADLRLLEDAFKRNPLLGYRPHAKQVLFHQPPHPALRAFFGGNRSGKTTAAVIDTIIQAIDPDMVPDHLKAYRRWGTPFFCRLVSPDLTNTMEGVVLEKFREWTPAEQLKGGSFDRAWEKQLRMLRFKNGSWIQFFSNDQDRDKFGGAALHRVVYDEEPRQDIRQECLTRLIDFDGEEIFAMTPFSGMSWLYDDVYEPWERGQLQDGRVVVVDMDDNPHLSPAGKRRALAQYSGEEREARKSGRFVHFAGLIYPEFAWDRVRRPELVIPDDPNESAVPHGFPVFVGIDPGLRFPAVVFCYLDFENTLVVFDELMMPGKTIRVVCEEIRKREEKWRIKPEWYVIDPAARNKNQQTGRSDMSEFQAQGIFPFPGQNEWRTGVNSLRQRLERDKLAITSNCQTVKDQFKRYRYATPPARAESDPREKPVKKDDHLLDALRYVSMARPLPPLEKDRPETMTMKDRLLRAHLSRIGRKQPADAGFGPGQFA